MDGIGLVLGGGGAKGGYEIGVWKALMELNIPIKAVTGTSVGALNGAMIVQNDYELAYKLWTSISTEAVIKTEKEAAKGNKKSIIDFIDIIKNVVGGGMDATPLRKLLEEVIDEERIRNSETEFGIVTFSLTDLKPVQLVKGDIPKGRIVDYLLASSCFPAFKPHEIDNKKFIDGGVYDNIPVIPMIEMGIRNIIVVDIEGPGLVRKANTRGINVKYIKCSEDLGGILDFDCKRAEGNIELGYLDTLKSFGKLAGNKYYILPKGESEDKIGLYKLGLNDLKMMYSFLGIELVGKSSPNSKLVIDRIVRTIYQYSDNKLASENIFSTMAEITAEQLQINRRKTYTLNELVKEIMAKYYEIKSSMDFHDYMENIKSLIKSRNQIEFDKELKKVMIEGKFLISYNPSIEDTSERIKTFRRFIAIAFPKISVANMFISFLISKHVSGEEV